VTEPNAVVEITAANGPAVRIGNRERLSLIAGPCQMESRQHALETAHALREAAERLGVGLIYKTSFDKANRTSVNTARGVGLKEALPIFAEIREATGLPTLTDVHEPEQCARAAEAVDVLQIPAFLCRQTDLLLAAGRTGKVVNVKKGQFLAPWDMKNVVEKVLSVGNPNVMACERGVSFGYNNLVVDMLGLAEMKKLGVPVTIDATHAVQLPGADPRTGGASTGGRRDGVATIAKAAVVSGADGVFLEFHPEPDKALCDAPSCLPLAGAKDLLATLKTLHAVANGRAPVA